MLSGGVFAVRRRRPLVAWRFLLEIGHFGQAMSAVGYASVLTIEASNHELAACIMERFERCRTSRDNRWDLDSHAAAGAVFRSRAVDRDGGGRRHDRGLEAAETPAPADRNR